jgi:hypothetical protein
MASDFHETSAAAASQVLAAHSSSVPLNVDASCRDAREWRAKAPRSEHNLLQQRKVVDKGENVARRACLLHAQDDSLQAACAPAGLRKRQP